MTSMMEKQPSKKAKSYNRFNGKQDHGDAASRKGHSDYGYWEDQYDHRGAANMDKTMLKQDLDGELNALDDIRDDTLALDMAEEDKKMAEAWALAADEDDFDLNDETYYSSNDHFDAEDGPGHSDYLKFLNNKLEQMRKELESIPHLTEDDPDYKATDQARLTLESEILEVVAEIREALNQVEYPEASYGVESKRDIRKRLARAATMDDYSEDDFGDTEQEAPKKKKKIR